MSGRFLLSAVVLASGLLLAAPVHAQYPSVPKETFEALKIDRSVSPSFLYSLHLFWRNGRALGMASTISISGSGDTNDFYVARMTRSNTNATIDTSIAYDMMSGAEEIVRNQAARQDGAITWWGGSWGARSDDGGGHQRRFLGYVYGGD